MIVSPLCSPLLERTTKTTTITRLTCAKHHQIASPEFVNNKQCHHCSQKVFCPQPSSHEPRQCRIEIQRILKDGSSVVRDLSTSTLARHAYMSTHLIERAVQKRTHQINPTNLLKSLTEKSSHSPPPIHLPPIRKKLFPRQFPLGHFINFLNFSNIVPYLLGIGRRIFQSTHNFRCFFRFAVF